MPPDPSVLGDRVHQILNNTVAFAALLSPDGSVRDVGQNALDAAGITLEDVVGAPFWDGFWFSYDDAVREKIRQAVHAAQRGEVCRFDYWARVVGDRRLLIDFQLSPILNDAGEVVELLASGFDVTERDQSKAEAETALREASHRIKNIFAMVRALATMTRKMSPPETALLEFIGRLDALEAVHRIFGGTHVVKDTTFGEIADSVLEPFLQEEMRRVIVQDGMGGIPRDQAKQLGLCLHEMATNAAKRGALSTQEGVISVSLGRTPSGRIRFEWLETFKAWEQTFPGYDYGLNFIRATLGGLIGGDVQVERKNDGFRISAEGDGSTLLGGG